jgi:dienelactone hydrolase
MYIKTILLFLIVTFTHTVALATDKEKEKRWADQISDSLVDGEAIKLSDGKNDFLAIDTRAETQEVPNNTGVIILHGIGIHPDWETVIQPLRVQLAEQGWNTLSLQMPVLDNDAKARDYQPLMKEVPARIDAGIRQMAKEGAKKVIIIAHSMGAQMANYYLAHKKTYREAQTDTPIVAYISIGMGAGNTKFLKKIKLPMLDLYGTDDLPAVKDSAPMRATASSHNKNYKQKVVKGANHFFEGKDDKLVEVVKEALLSFVK